MVAALVVVLAVVYLGVVALYAANERAVSEQGCPDTGPPDSLTMSLSPESVDAVTDRIAAKLDVVSLGPIPTDASGLPTNPVTLIVTQTDGPRTFQIAAGDIPSPLSFRLITDGHVESWPFDSHSVEVAFVAAQTVDRTGKAVPLQLCGTPHVPGWTFASEQIPGNDKLVVDGEPVTQLRITATRSAATVAFGIVLLLLLIALPVLALIVAILAFRGKRKVEATLTSWMAAMLFATVPLRTFLPGSPPIGSWVDYLVVLWVVAGLVAALAIYVAAWVRWAPRGGSGADD